MPGISIADLCRGQGVSGASVFGSSRTRALKRTSEHSISTKLGTTSTRLDPPFIEHPNFASMH